MRREAEGMEGVKTVAGRSSGVDHRKSGVTGVKWDKSQKRWEVDFWCLGEKRFKKTFPIDPIDDGKKALQV